MGVVVCRILAPRYTNDPPTAHSVSVFFGSMRKSTFLHFPDPAKIEKKQTKKAKTIVFCALLCYNNKKKLIESEKQDDFKSVS